MTSIPKTARLAGALYTVMSALMVFSYLVAPRAFFHGDAVAQAGNILQGESLYRLMLLAALVAQLLFVFVVVNLYELFQDVDRKTARLMMALVCVGVAAELVNVASRMAPLMLLRDRDFLAYFTKPQLDTLALAFVDLGSNLGRFLTSVWGLWLFPFGLLVIRSGYFPKVLGYLLMAAGAGYCIACVTFIVLPSWSRALAPYLMPLYFGELPIVFWMLIRGARASKDGIS